MPPPGLRRAGCAQGAASGKESGCGRGVGKPLRLGAPPHWGPGTAAHLLQHEPRSGFPLLHHQVHPQGPGAQLLQNLPAEGGGFRETHRRLPSHGHSAPRPPRLPCLPLRPPKHLRSAGQIKRMSQKARSRLRVEPEPVSSGPAPELSPRPLARLQFAARTSGTQEPDQGLSLASPLRCQLPAPTAKLGIQTRKRLV